MEQEPEKKAVHESVSRRGFISEVAAAAAGAVAVPRLLRNAGAAEAGKTRVVIVKSEQIVAKYKDTPAAIEPMADKLMCALTGKDKAEDAWASLFKPDQRVGIKVNCLFPPVTTTPPMADYVAKCLVKIGVKPGNIIIWDRNDGDMKKAGYQIVKEPNGVRVMGTTGHGDKVKAGPIETQLSKILLDDIDVLINMPVLKHHVLAGITASMKNHLGTVPNPGEFHKEICQYLADLCMLEPIRTKTKLIFMDATKAQYDKGPGHSPQCVWPYSGLLAATDMVAIDRVAAIEIKAKRNEAGLAGDIKPPAKHVDRAAELGLGVGDINKIDLVRLNM
jgi:uncharacterized protein (DUF362 family)